MNKDLLHPLFVSKITAGLAAVVALTAIGCGEPDKHEEKASQQSRNMCGIDFDPDGSGGGDPGGGHIDGDVGGGDDVGPMNFGSCSPGPGPRGPGQFGDPRGPGQGGDPRGPGQEGDPRGPGQEGDPRGPGQEGDPRPGGGGSGQPGDTRGPIEDDSGRLQDPARGGIFGEWPCERAAGGCRSDR